MLAGRGFGVFACLLTIVCGFGRDCCFVTIVGFWFYVASLLGVVVPI